MNGASLAAGYLTALAGVLQFISPDSLGKETHTKTEDRLRERRGLILQALSASWLFLYQGRLERWRGVKCGEWGSVGHQEGTRTLAIPSGLLFFGTQRRASLDHERFDPLRRGLPDLIIAAVHS